MSVSRFPLLHEWSLWKLFSFVALSYYNIDVSLSKKKSGLYSYYNIDVSLSKIKKWTL